MADHVADQASIGAEAGVLLPNLDAIGVTGTDGGQLEQAGTAHPGQLSDVLAAGQKVQEPKVADIPGDLQKPRCHGLKIGLHGIDHTPPFVDQPAPAPRQALEDVVLLRGCHDFLQHVAGHRQVIAELEQLQGLGRVDPVALGGGRKDLLEAR